MVKATPVVCVIKTHKEEIRIEPQNSVLSSNFIVDEVPTHEVTSTTETVSLLGSELENRYFPAPPYFSAWSTRLLHELRSLH
jgi:hypothetical protein